ncbi:branched-chain amino acid ABC transporter ATP-binding protein/permease [Bauldia sp.]|uniref:branched-chain amino acid ABC transporter ATP-binding protein/permease n=1 Tax=Bauldia sp. TaxID=2575872 RepID=UPI003BAB5A27
MIRGLVMLAVPLVATAAYGEWVASAAMANTITYAFILVVLVAGLGVFVGNTGILSFGHVAFVGIAGYATAILTIPPALKATVLPNLPSVLANTHLSPLVGGAIAVAVATGIGLAIGPAIARLGGAAGAIATLGLLIIAHSVFVGGTTFTRGAQAVFGVPKSISPLIAALAALLALALARSFKSSRWGLLTRAARENEPAARSTGIDVERARLFAFVASVALVAVGGVLFAHHLGVFSPKEFYFTLSFSLLAILIVGGQASVAGAVVGVALITILVEALRRIEPGFSLGVIDVPPLFGLTTIGVSVAVLLTLYFRSEGVMGFTEVEDFVRGRRTSRNRSVPDQAFDIAPLSGDRPRGQHLEAARVTKRYGGVIAVDTVSLTLSRGEILGLIGPNGSGKTTLLSCLTGVQGVDAGRITVDGTAPVRPGPMYFSRLGIARTFQNIRLFENLTVEENVDAALAAHGQDPRASDTTRALLRKLDLLECADRRAGELSYGQQRRLEIARALATDPGFLLLDEPAAGMNASESKALLALLAELRDAHGLGILLVDHDLHLILTLCDRVAVLNEGRLIAVGPPDEIRADDRVAAAYFGRQRNGPEAVAGERQGHMQPARWET